MQLITWNVQWFCGLDDVVNVGRIVDAVAEHAAIGRAELVHLAIQFDAGAVGAAATPRSIFVRSFLVAVTNPKGYLFCSALLPQFINANAPQWPQYATIAVVFASLDAVVMLGYALVGARAIRLLHRRAVRWLDRCCGGALLALAASLALYRRSAG